MFFALVNLIVCLIPLKISGNVVQSSNAFGHNLEHWRKFAQAKEASTPKCCRGQA